MVLPFRVVMPRRTFALFEPTSPSSATPPEPIVGRNAPKDFRTIRTTHFPALVCQRGHPGRNAPKDFRTIRTEVYGLISTSPPISVVMPRRTFALFERMGVWARGHPGVFPGRNAPKDFRTIRTQVCTRAKGGILYGRNAPKDFRTIRTMRFPRPLDIGGMVVMPRRTFALFEPT